MLTRSSAARDAALAYLERGWSVIPIRPRDKRPLVRWQTYQQQRSTGDEVREWFDRWPDANVGVVTGAVSGLVVLDVDPKHGGEESLARAEGEHGPLPRTAEVLTGGGGRHLYFLHPGGMVHNRAGLLPGIDLRGDGGLVVAPPSVHSSGRRYAWAIERAPWESTLASLPQWLLREIESSGGRAGHSLEHWRRLVREGVPEGSRNSTIASLAGHLLWHGMDEDVVLELLLCWNRARCRPPLPDDEVARTVESITRLHRRQDEETRS